MAASNVVKTVILGVGTLIVIYYAVTHQDKLKGYWDKFIASAQMQLGGSSAATGDNTGASTNVPTTTTAAPVAPAAPAPSSAVTPAASPAPAPAVTAPPIPPSLAPSILPPTPEAVQQTMFNMMPMNFTQPLVTPDQAQMNTFNSMPQNFNQPLVPPSQPAVPPLSLQDQGLNVQPPNAAAINPTSTTNRIMKDMTKKATPRVQTAKQKLDAQKIAAIQKGNVITPQGSANLFCTCSKAGKWQGTGCNVSGKFCGMAGSRGTGATNIRQTVR